MSYTGYTPVNYNASTNIDEHVKFIEGQVEKSVRDPEVRQLAIRIVSANYDWKRDPRTGQEEPFIHVGPWNKWFRVNDRGACPPRDDECEVVAIWDFVIMNFRYVYDTDRIDAFATARKSLEAGGGDCDDAVILINSLLRSVGFQTRARVISTSDDPGNWVHIYPLVGLPKGNPTEWLPLDMTVKDYQPGDEWHDIAGVRDYDM